MDVEAVVAELEAARATSISCIARLHAILIAKGHLPEEWFPLTPGACDISHLSGIIDPPVGKGRWAVFIEHDLISPRQPLRARAAPDVEGCFKIMFSWLEESAWICVPFYGAVIHKLDFKIYNYRNKRSVCVELTDPDTEDFSLLFVVSDDQLNACRRLF